MSTSLVGPEVGAPAPEIALTGWTGRATSGAPRVLAFVTRGFEAPGPTTLRQLRAQLRGLGAELVVLSPAGAWSMRADDPPEQLAPLAGDVAATARQYGVDRGEAVFVIDGAGVVR